MVEIGPPMAHPLDNAAWHALTGPQRAFARVGTLAARYRPEISPIAALAEESDAAFDELAALTRPGEVVAMASTRAYPEREWQALANVDLGQWIQDGRIEPESGDGIATLGAADKAEMLALARLADPGPFELETWQLGTYLGIRDGATLAAMAGERMRLPGYIEVSAVATRPGSEGRGYASRLVRALLIRQQAAGEQAFLHVRIGSPAERAATHVYQKLGFTLRWTGAFRIALRRG
jgi:ribosomal protein S18 acetylase RimI-like enzyme